MTAGENDRSASALGTPARTMSAKGQFPMGSVTKSWTAIGIMQHYENGTIDIDAPISKSVGGLALAPRRASSDL